MTLKPVAMLVSFALVISACTSNADDPSETTSTQTATTGESTGGAVTPTGPGAPVGDPVDVPALPVVAVDGFGEPGATIEVTGDSRLEGELSLVGPDGDLSSATMDSGSAALPIPPGTAQGRYGLRLGEDKAWGSLTVMESPGLAVLGAGYVGSGDAPEVEVFIHGVDTGDVVAVELRSGDGSIQRLVPHPLLGLAPVPTGPAVQGLTEGRHTLVLPAGFEGTARLVADNPATLSDPFAEAEPALFSNDLRILACDDPSAISGDLRSGGVVTVHSARTVSRERTDAGTFVIDVAPGWNLVSAIHLDGTSPPPQLIKVGCGATVEVGDLEQAIDSGPEPGEYLGGLTIDDLWAYTATATGDLAFEQESFADCSIDDGALEVTFGSFSSDPWLYTLTLSPPIDGGAYEGSLHLEDIFSGDTADGTLVGEIEVGRVDDLDAVGGAFSGSIEGALGSSDITIRFTCAVFSLTGGLSTPGATGVAAALPAAPPSGALLLSQAGGSGTTGDPCKKLFIYGTEPEGTETPAIVFVNPFTSWLTPELPRLRITTMSDVLAFMDLEAQRQLLGTYDDPEVAAIDLAGAVESDYLLYLDNRSIGETWSFTATLYDLEQARRLASFDATGASSDAAADAAMDRWRELVEPLANAGICAEFTPESAVVDVGATEEFTIEVTNLAGEPAESPEVVKITSKCGTWEPAEGSIDGDSWETKFKAGDKACAENVSARVTAKGTVDEVDADPETSIQTEAMWQFATTTTFEDEHSQITAESSGEFFVESDFDALIGAGTGYIEGSGEAYCEVNGAVTWQPYKLVGTYQVMVAGEVTERPEIDAPWTVKFAPMGFEINTEMTYSSSSDCIEAGTYSNDLLGFFGAGALVGWPHWYANLPNGFITYMRPEGDGIPFEETLTGLPGGSIRGILWKPQP